MPARSFGVVTVAFASVMVALLAQMGAIALILGGSVFTVLGSMQGAAALLIGALFLGLAVASYAVGFGVWTRKRWAWSGAVAILATLIVAVVLLSLLAGDPRGAILPIGAAAAGLWQLSRPTVKAEMLGAGVAAGLSTPRTDGIEVPEGAR